jgi:hypothetical protein
VSSTSTDIKAHEDAAYKEHELNLEMWKHFDNLRQDKSKTFLTAQTILIALSGFVLKSQELNPVLRIVVLLVSGLGLVSSLLWVVLLSRNKAYIEFHRKRVRELEEKIRFTTFSKEWECFEDGHYPEMKLRPSWVKSNTIDMALAFVFALFWLCLGAVGLIFYF